jgi:diadenosine tetraphosphate (Ap4A) HIT family hydrolase
MTDPTYDQFRIMQGNAWDVYISERGGNNLGRLYLWLKRDGIIDYDELTDAERDELLQLHRTFKKALRQFQPDGPLNFAYLANEESHGHHCHYHLVPRYKEPRVFNGVEFIDVSWGHPWTSAGMDSELAISVRKQIMLEVAQP